MMRFVFLGFIPFISQGQIFFCLVVVVDLDTYIHTSICIYIQLCFV